MTELYWGTTADFIDRATQNTIAETLRGAFFEFQGFNPSESEQRSWRNSLRALALALELGGFTDQGLFLEFHLPLSSRRLDAMVTGRDPEARPAAVIVELKQWDSCEPSDIEDVVVVRYGGRPKEVLPPSAQARQYREHLADGHTAFHDDAIRLHACAFLHDFLHDPDSELLNPRHANILGVYPLFPGDRVSDLVGRGQGLLGAQRHDGRPVSRSGGRRP